MKLINSSKSILALFLVTISSFSSADNEFVKNHQNFATHFYSSLIHQNEGKSLIFSPFSLQSCFSMLYVGTKGPAANELERGFHLGSSDRQVVSQNFKDVLDKYKDNQYLKTFNKIYVDSHATLVPEFKEVAEKNFNSEVETADLTKGGDSASIVNNWVNEKTGGKIEKLIEPQDCNADTRLILLNAIYFKGNWKKKFNKEETEKKPFWISENESIDVDTMRLQTQLKFKKERNLRSYVVDLPYANSDLSMLLVVPMQREGLSFVETKLQETNLEELTSGLHEHDINLFLPKFKVETSLDLKDVLKQLGVEKVYTNPDLTDLAKASEPLKLVKAVHKAIVEVNEEGTEAAAATGAAIQTRVGPLPIIVNRPFLFIIKDNTGRTFFMGRYLGKE